MTNTFASYRKNKQKKINEKMANWRKAKAAKRLNAEPPPYPPDLSGKCRVVIVQDYDGNKMIGEEIYMLDKQGSRQINSWWLWKDGERIGLMGWWKALCRIGKDFPAMRNCNER